jgi:hypothetical protein
MGCGFMGISDELRSSPPSLATIRQYAKQIDELSQQPLRIGLRCQLDLERTIRVVDAGDECPVSENLADVYAGWPILEHQRDVPQPVLRFDRGHRTVEHLLAPRDRKSIGSRSEVNGKQMFFRRKLVFAEKPASSRCFRLGESPERDRCQGAGPRTGTG